MQLHYIFSNKKAVTVCLQKAVKCSPVRFSEFFIPACESETSYRQLNLSFIHTLVIATP